MKKKIAAALAATFALGVTTVFANSPFADVPAKHWSYDAVKKLAQAGIVEGYGDGTFRGQNTITRYEMAIIVANAATKMDKADAEQKAMINKLASEYSAELDKIGARVTAVEKKVDNVKFTGQARLRYSSFSFENNPGNEPSIKGQYRLRLDGSAKVDDNTTFDFRFVTREPDRANFSNSTFQDFGSNGQSSGNNNNFDRIAINTRFGQTSVLVGRQAFFVDTQTAFVDYTALSFDGIKAATKVGKFDITGTYGRFLKDVTKYAGDNQGTAVVASPLKDAAANLDVASLTVGSTEGKLSYSLGYYELKNFSNNTTPYKWTVVNSNYKFNKNYNLNVEYLTNGGTEIYVGQRKSGYSVQLAIGDTALGKPGAQVAFITYLSKGANSTPTILSGAGTPLTNAEDFNNFDFQYYYAFSKNFNIGVQYSLVRSDATVPFATNKLYRVLTNVRF